MTDQEIAEAYDKYKSAGKIIKKLNHGYSGFTFQINDLNIYLGLTQLKVKINYNRHYGKLDTRSKKIKQTKIELYDTNNLENFTKFIKMISLYCPDFLNTLMIRFDEEIISKI